MTDMDWILGVLTAGACFSTYWYAYGGQDRYNLWRVKRITRRHPSAFGTMRWK